MRKPKLTELSLTVTIDRKSLTRANETERRLRKIERELIRLRRKLA